MSGAEEQRRRRWPRAALLFVTITGLGLGGLVTLDQWGLGPNLGLSFGYYGRFNQTLDRIQANPDIEVVRTTLHRDLELEDFYITVRTHDGSQVRLCFENANTRPFSELLLELKRVGC